MKLQKSKVLTYIKLAHTLWWLFFAGLILYILCAGVAGRVGSLALGAMVLAGAHGAVLHFNGWRYPLHGVAKNMADSPEKGFDIFLPRFLKRNDRLILTGLYLLGLLVVIYRWLQ